MRYILKIALGLLTVVAAGNALRVSAQNAPASGSSHVRAASTAANPAEGEVLFQTHCVRCHNPPEDLSPREARAALRHMRVRATLSAEDERALLKYLAP